MFRERAATRLSVAVSLIVGLWVIAALIPGARLETEPMHKRPAEDLPVPPTAAPSPAAQPTPRPSAPVLALPDPPPPPDTSRSKVAAAATPEPAPTPAPAPEPAPKRTTPPAAAKPVQTRPTSPKPAPARPVVAIPAATVTPKADPEPPTRRAGRSDLAAGRPLLRILEHGRGPTIEIAWPDGTTARDALYDGLTRCYGMRVALFDPDGGLFVAEGPAGGPWDIDLDRYSGFLRQPSGALARAERRAAQGIRSHHGGLAAARAVRIFPRRVDALLLGGLSSLIGAEYRSARSIRAAYRRQGRDLVIERVTVDGRPVAGRIDLGAAARCGRGA